MPDVKNKSGIDAKTALFGLLGNPVGHSMSPFMQNQFLEQCGVNGVYLAFAVEKDAIGDAIRGMHAMGVQGANVTIPHKEAVIPHLCGMSKAAQACGAVNTLVYTPEGYYGDNTDGSGLLAALAAKNGWKAAGQKSLRRTITRLPGDISCLPVAKGKASWRFARARSGIFPPAA